jgi:hypothetical protein
MSNWLMVGGHLDQKDNLRLKKIPFSQITIHRPLETTGLAFPQEYFEQAMIILGLANRSFAMTETDRPGVSYLTERRSRPAARDDRVEEIGDLDGAYRFTVQVDNDEHFFGLEHWDEIEPVLRNFAGRIKRNIVVSNPHGESFPPMTDPETLYIRFWSTPKESTKHIKIHQVFGWALGSSQSDALLPSGKGFFIRDDDTIIAELVEDTLYVLFDLPHSQGCGLLMAGIIERLEPFLVSPGFEKQPKKVAGRGRNNSRQAYIDLCSRRGQSERTTAEAQLIESQAKIQQSGKLLAQAIQKQLAARERLAVFGNDAELEEQYGKEFDQILSFEGVQRVEVKNNVILVFTDPIEIEYQNSIYDIGSFRIEIYPNADSGGVKCFNLSRQTPNGFHHPHIGKFGECCLGNIAAGIFQFIGEHQYAPVVQIMLKYLESYKPENPYQKISAWPLKLD